MNRAMKMTDKNSESILQFYFNKNDGSITIFFSDCKLIVHVLQNSNLSNYHIIPFKYPGYFEWKRGIFIEFTLISGH